MYPKDNIIFNYFEEISRIPRCSFDEQKISDYLLKFGKDNGLEAIQDEFNNITLIKEASLGMEDKEGIILQGHMDMVCEKTNESDHDFTKDPIELIVEDGYLRANNTTLGADNGIAIAIGLAILTDKSLTTPRIELVITTSEETGLEGATNYKDDILTGKYFINLDSEEEGYLVAGCAGGINMDIDFEFKKELYSGYLNKFHIYNLKGGHSGMNIGDNLLNAILSINKFLLKAMKISDISLVSINGGTKHNAIPRDAYLEFISAKKLNLDYFSDIIEELKLIEENCTVDFVTEFVDNKYAFNSKTSKEIIDFLSNTPNGVEKYMTGEYKDIVQTSSNLSIINTDSEKIHLLISIRSSKNDEKDNLTNKIKNLVENYKGKVLTSGDYTSWEFRDESKLRDIATKAYKELTGDEMIVSVIHAGLECAIFQNKYPNIDTISIGPNMQGVHTPEEKLDINSTKRVYEYLKHLIKTLSK